MIRSCVGFGKIPRIVIVSELTVLYAKTLAPEDKMGSMYPLLVDW